MLLWPQLVYLYPVGIAISQPQYHPVPPGADTPHVAADGRILKEARRLLHKSMGRKIALPCHRYWS